jgi:biopolymer transport protein ExbD
MATGDGHGKRPLNQEIPLIPFIDFLLCLVSFLLITSVWSQMARINADARVPGPPTTDPIPPDKVDSILHVEMASERNFTLLWKKGQTVVNTIDVERKAVPIGGAGDFAYPDLAKRISEEWNQHGSHRSPADLKVDQAVLHTANTTPFRDVIAVIDAVYSPQREFKLGSEVKSLPAFNVTFAIN